MGSRATRFRAGMVYGSTTPSLVVTRSCHSSMAGAHHTARTPRPFTIHLLTTTTTQDQAAIGKPTLGRLIGVIPRAVPRLVAVPLRVVQLRAVPLRAAVILTRQVVAVAGEDILHIRSSRE